MKNIFIKTNHDFANQIQLAVRRLVRNMSKMQPFLRGGKITPKPEPSKGAIFMKNEEHVDTLPPKITVEPGDVHKIMPVGFWRRVDWALGVLFGSYQAVRLQPKIIISVDDRCKFLMCTGSKHAIKFNDGDRRFAVLGETHKLPGTD